MKKTLKVEGCNKDNLSPEAFIRNTYKHFEEVLGKVETLSVVNIAEGKAQKYRLFNIGNMTSSLVNIEGIVSYVNKIKGDIVIVHNHPLIRPDEATTTPSPQDIDMINYLRVLLKERTVYCGIYSNSTEKVSIYCSLVKEEGVSHSKKIVLDEIKKYLKENNIKIDKNSETYICLSLSPASLKVKILCADTVSSKKDAIRLITKMANEGIASLIRITKDVYKPSNIYDFINSFLCIRILDNFLIEEIL